VVNANLSNEEYRQPRSHQGISNGYGTHLHSVIPQYPQKRPR
jgi:hypothetical protein